MGTRFELEDVIVSYVRPTSVPINEVVVTKSNDVIPDEGFAIDSFAAPVDPSDPSDGLRPMESLLGGPDTTPGPDDFVAVSDAFAYDKLAVDQTSADPSDSFIPVEQVRPMESLLPTDSSDSTGTAFDDVVMVDCPILSNPNESGDWILI